VRGGCSPPNIGLWGGGGRGARGCWRGGVGGGGGLAGAEQTHHKPTPTPKPHTPKQTPTRGWWVWVLCLVGFGVVGFPPNFLVVVAPPKKGVCFWFHCFSLSGSAQPTKQTIFFLYPPQRVSGLYKSRRYPNTSAIRLTVSWLMGLVNQKGDFFFFFFPHN